MLQARIEDCRKAGGNPFGQLQIPQAAIALKQGAGRLIRDETDRGVLVICDNRLVTKDYAKTFLRSLPNMRRTRHLPNALAFLEEIHHDAQLSKKSQQAAKIAAKEVTNKAAQALAQQDVNQDSLIASDQGTPEQHSNGQNALDTRDMLKKEIQ